MDRPTDEWTDIRVHRKVTLSINRMIKYPNLTDKLGEWSRLMEDSARNFDSKKILSSSPIIAFIPFQRKFPTNLSLSLSLPPLSHSLLLIYWWSKCNFVLSPFKITSFTIYFFLLRAIKNTWFFPKHNRLFLCSACNKRKPSAIEHPFIVT